MSATLTPVVAGTHALAPRPPACAACGHEAGATPQAICPECLGPLEPVYDPNRPLPTREEIAARPRSLWRYREWLPFDGAPVHALDVGWTPLVDAPRLAARLGVARAWLKLDAHSFPSLSFKDRVVSTAINAAEAFGLDVIGCASTGNLANAVAAAAVRWPSRSPSSSGGDCRRRSSRRWRGDRWSPSCARASPRCATPDSPAARCHASTARRRADARRSCASPNAATTCSFPRSRTPSHVRSRSAIRPTASRRVASCARAAAPARMSPTPNSSPRFACWHARPGSPPKRLEGRRSRQRSSSPQPAPCGRTTRSSCALPDTGSGHLTFPTAITMPTFHLPSVLAAHVGGTRAVDTSGATVGQAVDELVQRFPQLGSRLRDAHGDPYPFVTFYLNDEDLRLVGGFGAAVSDGDEVTIVPAVAGG